ncbi:hypothetical protein E2C01_074491 [Portunus trituberculatus]|uniref:Uncharacterized protein n=1 Tax=Portunus trituberculatus TaxID=210409 RepID=A0A5B7IC98_PORTR|nr:hypothetical protein [Portunus trituberculatus]
MLFYCVIQQCPQLTCPPRSLQPLEDEPDSSSLLRHHKELIKTHLPTIAKVYSALPAFLLSLSPLQLLISSSFSSPFSSSSSFLLLLILP